MYSGVPHIIDLYNDTEDMRGVILLGVHGSYVQLSCRIKKDIEVDSTGTIYVHLTDGVQHMRLPVRIEVPEKGKGKK